MTDRDAPFEPGCAEVREILSAMLDGEADPGEQITVQRHVSHCAGCQAYERDLMQLWSKISDQPQRPGDGAAAWARARAEIAAMPSKTPPVTTRTQLTHWAAAAVVVLGMGLAAWQLWKPAQQDGAIIAEAARDFQVFQASGEVLDIAATHPDAVYTWMTARVDFMLPNTLKAPESLRIAGARLCSLLGRKLAFIAYQAEGRDVGLYISKADGLNLPRDGSIEAISREGGVTTIGWRSGDLAYVVVSKLSIEKLSAYSAFFQRASLTAL